MFKGLLDGIISIRILCKFYSIGDEFFHHLRSVFGLVGLSNDNFNHTEATIIGGKFYKSLIDLIENELTVGFIKTFDYVLDHMGALNIL